MYMYKHKQDATAVAVHVAIIIRSLNILGDEVNHVLIGYNVMLYHSGHSRYTYIKL